MKNARPQQTVKPPLSSFEHEVMHAVWSGGPSSVELVHSRVSRGRDVKEVTTRTVLRRLEQKGYLQHDEESAGWAEVIQWVNPACPPPAEFALA